MFTTATARAMGRAGLAIAGLGCMVVLAACATPGLANSAAVSPSAPAASTSAAPSSPAVSPSSPAAAPVPATPSQPTLSATTHPAGGTLVSAPQQCRADQLSAGPVRGGAAMGSLGYTIRLTNHGHGSCRIAAGLVLYQTASGGSEKRIPIEAETAHPKSLLLAAGKAIETNVLITNGYSGYAPDSPHCAHPVVYRGISVGVGSGLIALSQLVLDVRCDGVRAYDWYLA